MTECGPDTVRCDTARNPSVATAACCKRWNVEILRTVATGLDRLRVPWWIDYGTHLGFMVNGGLYWNDKDTDVCALVDDRQLIMSMIPAWQAQGYSVRYHPLRRGPYQWGDVIKVRLSRKNKTNCDITFWHRCADGYLDRQSYSPTDEFKGRAMPASWIFPTTRGLWEGVPVNVPAEPELLVAHRYGDWRNLPAAYSDGVKRGDARPEREAA